FLPYCRATKVTLDGVPAGRAAQGAVCAPRGPGIIDHPAAAADARRNCRRSNWTGENGDLVMAASREGGSLRSDVWRTGILVRHRVSPPARGACRIGEAARATQEPGPGPARVPLCGDVGPRSVLPSGEDHDRDVHPLAEVGAAGIQWGVPGDAELTAVHSG